MDLSAILSVLFFTIALFSAGFGVGGWLSERGYRKDLAASRKGRINIDMPADPEDAQAMLALLADLLQKAEAERRVRLDEE